VATASLENSSPYSQPCAGQGRTAFPRGGDLLLAGELCCAELPQDSKSVHLDPTLLESTVLNSMQCVARPDESVHSDQAT
jgi:hypothetical protein